MKQLFIVMLLVTLTASCGGAGVRKENTPAGEVSRAGIGPVSTDIMFHVELPESFEFGNISFFAIPGELFGPTNRNGNLERLVERGGSLMLSHDHLLSMARANATPFRAADTILPNRGLNVDPPQTRIARIGQLFQPNVPFNVPIITGIHDQDDHAIMLVYVDRPSSFSGVHRNFFSRQTFDATFPEEGLYWVATSSEANVSTLVLPDPPQAVFIRVELAE